MRNTETRAVALLSNGKCPNCKTQIEIIESGHTVYKTRLVKQFKKKGLFVKCPDCSHMLRMS